MLERQEIEREGRVGEGVIQTGQSTVSRCWFSVSFLLRFEGAASMMSGDKTASVMTSWTTKVLNSRRRRRQFLEFRSSASAARRPTPAAPRNVMAVLVMLQKLNAILRNGRILLPRRIIFEPIPIPRERPAGRRCEFRSFGRCMPQTEMFQMNRELPLLIDDEEDHVVNSVTTSLPEIGV